MLGENGLVRQAEKSKLINERAKVKEVLIPYIAGCIVIFGAFTIWKIIVTILQNAG